jgi:hypothetical protein
MNTLELEGAALDWAVAKCEGNCEGDFSWYYDRRDTFNYSTDWAQGGPIIERERIGIDCDDQGVWFASFDLSAETALGSSALTPLIAAMRCYVSSKLGDDVDVPKEIDAKV